jgi:choline dehydrogenase
MLSEFDYIVVGAGSAGCAIAARLSEDPATRVLLIEAGGDAHRWDIRLQMPAAMALPTRSKRLNWGYVTEPQAELNGRRIAWARGRVMGGSSSINGMVFVRGHAADYDAWAQDPELADWSYADVLPYFKRLETFGGGGDFYRGDRGPVHVSVGRGWSPLYDTFLQAGVEAGYDYTEDMNGAQQEGFGRMDMTVHGGRRINTADAYIRPLAGRANLAVLPRAHVTSLILEKQRCRGVRYRSGGGHGEVFAAREVILCAGAIGSPHLLMLSGIGAADELRAAGVEPHHDLPGVGRNLQDHVELFLQYGCTQPVTLHPTTRWLPRLLVGARWLLRRDGWGATNHFEAGAFVRSSDAVAWPDVQFHFVPRAIRYDASDGVEVEGFQLNIATMRSKARGWMRLASADPATQPLIDPRYMTHPDDWTEMRQAIAIARDVVAQPAFDAYRGAELLPGAAVTTEADLDAFIRAQAVTGYHPCGACKMGSGPEAVVDGALRVHGIDGLRVADSSVMPTITTGNLNAPSIMIGEKAADLIRGRRLPPAPVASRDQATAPARAAAPSPALEGRAGVAERCGTSVSDRAL